MLSIKHSFSFIYLIFFAIILPFINAVPVLSKDDPLAEFVKFLTQNNCSMPKAVDIPFQVTNSSAFSYLFTPLKECESPKALKEKSETNLLCKEAFDVLQNITCNDYSKLPKINSSGLSADICSDFAAKQEILPKQKDYLSGKLGDGILCNVLCSENYKLLCKTLLWSYDTQAKIKKVLDSKLKENEKEGINDIVSSKTDDPNEKITTELGEGGQDNQEKVNEISDKINIVPDSENTKKLPDKSSLVNFENQSLPKNPVSDEGITNKSVSSVSSNKEYKIINSNFSQITQNDNPNKINTQVSIQKDPQKNSPNESLQPSEQNPELPNENIHENFKTNIQEENVLDEQPKNNIVENPAKDSKLDSSTTKVIDNVSKGSNNSLIGLPVNENEENVKSSITVKPSKTSTISESDVDSGMSNVGLQEPSENEVKDEKGTDSKNKQENSKENFVPDKISPETDPNFPSTTSSVYSEKNEDLEHPDVKDPELYNDSENEDYPKQEYDNGFGLSPKKETGIKNSVDDVSSQISSSSSIQINPENFPGRFDGNQNFLPARNYLPDQEDSHFFFYFLSIVLILMAGYLIFHNKQKIIALIVEGRHERRRRSHGAGYKKLETK